MSCLHAKIELVDSGLCACVENVGNLSVDYDVVKKAKTKVCLIVQPIQNLDANIDFAYAKLLAEASSCNVPIFVKIDNFCGQIIPTPYLEIEPEVLWVYPDFSVENYVYSTTNWFLN